MRRWVRTGGSELSADFTLWTPAAYGVPMVPEPVLEVESEEEYLVTRMDEFGRWWSRWEVFLGMWFLHDPLMAWSGGTSPGRAG